MAEQSNAMEMELTSEIHPADASKEEIHLADPEAAIASIHPADPEAAIASKKEIHLADPEAAIASKEEIHPKAAIAVMAEQGTTMELTSEVHSADPEAAGKSSPENLSLAGNELAIDAIYMQQFKVLQESKTAEFKKRISAYAKTLLNDPKFGIVFYKAHIFSNSEVKQGESIRIGDLHPHVEYILHFHTFAVDYLTKEKMDEIEKTYLPDLLDSDGGRLAEVTETKLIIHEDTDIRKPVYYEEATDSAPPQNPGSEPNTCCQKFINFWLVVPKAQTEFFNLLYQMYSFDIAHQGFFVKFVHFFTIPINIILFFMFFAQFKLPGSYIEDTTVRRGPFFFPTNWTYLPLGLLVLAYIIMGFLRKCIPWGFGTAIVITMLWGVGNLFYEEVRLPKDANATGIYKEIFLNPVYLPYNPIFWSYIVSFIQAFSHMFVPQMPPYITGVTHWESLSQFLWNCKGPCRQWCRGCCNKILALGCFPILSVGVAYFSWPHLIGTQVFYIMAGIGYDHKDFKKYKLVTEKAELSGNPRCAHFPTTADTLMNPEDPYKKHLEAHGIIDDKDKLDAGKVAKEVATSHIYNTYFHGRHHAKDPRYRDSHIYHYQALNDHYYTLKSKA